MLESVLLEKGLEGKTFGLENLNKKIENSLPGSEEREDLLRKAAGVERDMDRIEKMMGISAEEIMSFYETLSPEDAKDIIIRTFEKIPPGVIDDSLKNIDQLKKIGGKIMCWASIKSPMEAALIAASIMIIVTAEPGSSEAAGFASEIGRRLTGKTTVSAESAEEPEQFFFRENHLGGDELEKRPLFEDSRNGLRFMEEEPVVDPNIVVNGEPARIIEDNNKETVWGGKGSVYSNQVHIGTVTIKK